MIWLITLRTLLSLSWGVWLCINYFHVNLRFLFIFNQKKKKIEITFVVLELNDLAHEFENFLMLFA